MPNINFPSGPITGQPYTFNGSTWIYNGKAWILNGTSGPQGPQGPTGGGGGGGTSFFYNDVAFVHPSGDDLTAVIGDMTLPFSTIEAAYNSLVTAASMNGVIEIWPGVSYDPTIPTYDYVENFIMLVDTYNLTIHLKPNVHIKFDASRGVLDATSFFTVDNGRTLKITSDDSTSSITFFEYDNIGDVVGASNLIIENLSLNFSYKRDGKSATTNGIRVVQSSVFIMKNTFFSVLDTEVGTAASGSLYIIYLDTGGIFESYNNRIEITDYVESQLISFIYIIGGKGTQKVYLHNTQTISNATSAQTTFRIVSCVSSTIGDCLLTIDGCVFWINNAYDNYLIYATTELDINLVSRSIHNYASTDNSHPTYLSGAASSITDLSVSGYGFLEAYSTSNLMKPFNSLN